jgi:post-segregation antitoxin (ccd killing protein)|tara:strand:- start:199 stop:1602 length:1404 start_codon:yes stop_codon:yes gene_type:complete
MNKKKKECKGKSVKITGIDITDDTLTSRGGLSLFVRYLDAIWIMSIISRLFGSIRKNSKGNGIEEIFKQLLCNFVDGTSRHLVHYDRIKEDTGYAGVIESTPATLMSSHAVKRFFTSFSLVRIWLFSILLQKLFIWRLNLNIPNVIELFIDTMVMDNNEARLRHGVQPTYKGKNGFQPLQMIWERYIIDAVFRGGKKHSNHGDTVEKMVRHVVQNIRTKYRSDVPIIFKLDSGFFDQKLFEVFEELDVGYVVSGKLYDDIKEYARKVKYETWQQYQNKEQIWDYVEFVDKRGSWTKARRAICCSPRQEGAQLLLEFARPDTILYTNLGMGQKIDELLARVGQKKLLNAEKIIECAHSRGSDELIHRAFKDFGHEELPFKKFAPNAAYYYTMVLAFFLFESFKDDVCAEIIPLVAYATTVRRKLIDCAAKIVKTSGNIILKVTSATWKNLKFDVLWERSGSPPRFVWA